MENKTRRGLNYSSQKTFPPKTKEYYERYNITANCLDLSDEELDEIDKLEKELNKEEFKITVFPVASKAPIKNMWEDIEAMENYGAGGRGKGKKKKSKSKGIYKKSPLFLYGKHW
ncbi:MAG: hypothetical protein FWE18_00090 [Alphaproteobacteria bacterium]|nr:hypothetical protein [Alphaproteobacteria bacterium]